LVHVASVKTDFVIAVGLEQEVGYTHDLPQMREAQDRVQQGLIPYFEAVLPSIGVGQMRMGMRI
jgi:hypothetical protein